MPGTKVQYNKRHLVTSAFLTSPFQFHTTSEFFYTSTKSWGGGIFLLQFVCLSVCLSQCMCLSLCMCLSCSACEQNSSRTDELIWARFSLNGCLLYWLKPYWNWLPWVKGQSHRDVIPFYLHNSLLTFLLCMSALMCSINLKFGIALVPRYNTISDI